MLWHRRILYSGFILIAISINFFFAQSTFVKKFHIFDNGYSSTDLLSSSVMKDTTIATMVLGYSGYSWTYVGFIKFDTSGNILISKKILPRTFGRTNFENKNFYVTSDNGIILNTTYIGPAGEMDFCIIKLDKNFNLQWAKLIGGPSVEFGTSIIQTKKDKSYIAVGYTGSFGVSGSDIYVVKLDSNGNFLWSRTYGGPKSDEAYGIIESDNNTYVICGATESYATGGAGDFDAYLLKIDSVGNILWTKTFGGTLYDNALSILKDKNNLVVGGITNSFTASSYPNPVYIFKTPDDSSKTLLWVTLLDRRFLFHQCITKTNMGYAGVSMYPPKLPVIYSELNSYFFHLDTNGKVIDTRRFPFAMLVGVQQINNSFYINGKYNLLNYDPPDPTEEKAVFIKTNQHGQTCIPDSSVAFKYVSGIVGSGGAVTSVNQGTIANYFPILVDDGIDSTLCSCPYISYTLSTKPFDCYSPGSATISTSFPNLSYIWSPNVSSSYTASNLSPGSYTCTLLDTTSGCSKEIVFTINSNLSFPLSLSYDSLICSGLSTTISASGAQFYTWSNGSTTNSITVQPSSTTTYTVWAQAGVCTQSAVITISVVPNPTAGLLPFPSVVNAGDTITLSAFGGSHYEWSPTSIFGNNNSPTAVISPTASFDFCLKAENVWGCFDTICRHIQVEGSCFNFIVPNIFTPNNDGINDYWLIPFQCPQLIKDFHLSIFDRWGIKLFETNKFNAGWDGRTISGEPVPTGTYYYVAEFYMNNKKQELKGYLTLLR